MISTTRLDATKIPTVKAVPVSFVLQSPLRSSYQIARIVFLLAACICIVSTQARAQALGVITGTVTDPSGAAVPRAHITATETGTGFERSITTDDTGRYTLPSLRPTEYSLTVEASGFAKYVQRSVRLLADQTATIDVQLKVPDPLQSSCNRDLFEANCTHTLAALRWYFWYLSFVAPAIDL